MRPTAGFVRPWRRRDLAGSRLANAMIVTAMAKSLRAEFPGSDADFARLDRDHDQSLTAADFDFSASALAPSPGSMVFSDGSIATAAARSRAKSSTRSSASDSGSQGFLSLSDLQEAFTPAANETVANHRAVRQRPRWSAGSFARRSARFSRAQSSTNPRLTSP